MRGKSNKPVENSVGRNEDAMNIGVFRDPLQFGYPADIFRVRADDNSQLASQ